MILKHFEKISSQVHLIERYLQKQIVRADLTIALNCSPRTVERKISRYNRSGMAGLTHGLVGKPGNRALKPETKAKAIDAWKNVYSAHTANMTHVAQLMERRENIKLHSRTLKNLLVANKLLESKEKAKKRAYKLRIPKASRGEMIQLDGSYHDWLEPGKKCYLIVAIDDATSEIVWAQFFDHDGTLPNLEVLYHVIENYGIPASVYTDRAAWYFITPKQKIHLRTPNQVQKVSTESETQYQRVLRSLGIKAIPAYSAQAKGRVERSNDTLQDRLVTELRINNITTIEGANRYLINVYLPDHKERFARKPRDLNDAFIKPKIALETIKKIMCQQYLAVIKNDNTFSAKSGSILLQLEKTPNRLNWAKAPAVLEVTFDKQLTLKHRNTNEIIPFKILSFKPKPEKKYTYMDDWVEEAEVA